MRGIIACEVIFLIVWGLVAPLGQFPRSEVLLVASTIGVIAAKQQKRMAVTAILTSVIVILIIIATMISAYVWLPGWIAAMVLGTFIVSVVFGKWEWKRTPRTGAINPVK